MYEVENKQSASLFKIFHKRVPAVLAASMAEPFSVSHVWFSCTRDSCTIALFARTEEAGAQRLPRAIPAPRAEQGHQSPSSPPSLHSPQLPSPKQGGCLQRWSSACPSSDASSLGQQQGGRPPPALSGEISMSTRLWETRDEGSLWDEGVADCGHLPGCWASPTMPLLSKKVPVTLGCLGAMHTLTVSS